MPGLIIASVEVEVPGLFIQNWNDNPKLRLVPGDRKPRPRTWVRGVVLHTTRGIPGGSDKRPQVIKPGLGPDTKRDERIADMWAADDRHAGAHLIVDHDASWTCLADLQLEAAFHAGNVNDVTIGIEMYQDGNAALYEGQLESVVKMVDFLTRKFSIQRQVPHRYVGYPLDRGLDRGLDMVGVYGHRDCSNNRGSGDPGDTIFKMLVAAGYEPFDFSANRDKTRWMERQEALGLLADGVPGPKTVAALRAAGHTYGLWVDRPGD